MLYLRRAALAAVLVALVLGGAGTVHATTSDYPSAVLADSPYVYWRQEETTGTSAADSSGNGRTGTYNNGPSLGQDGLVSGGGKSVGYDAVNDYLRSDFMLNTSVVTVEVWFDYDGTPLSGNAFVAGFANGFGDGVNDKDLWIDNTGRAAFYVWDGAPKVATGTTVLPAGRVHLVGTYDGTNANIYVNGVLEGSVAASSTYTNYWNSDIFVGGYVIGGPGSVQKAGRRDEFAVYTSALSPARILAHYNAGISVGKNVSSFGAVGNGIANDTAALNAAFADPGPVYSDPGKTYKITGQLNLKTTANFNGSTITGNTVSAASTTATMSNVVLTASTSGNGFYVDGGNSLVCTNCRATSDGIGFLIGAGAGSRTSISGSTSRNTMGIRDYGTAGGSIGPFTSDNDDHWGILFSKGAAHWRLTQIVASDEGQTSGNTSATGVELWGDDSGGTPNFDITADSITANNNLGYGLALTGHSHNNTFTSLTGNIGADPCLTVTNGSYSNEFTNIHCVGYAAGINVGEDNTTANNNNHFGTVYIENAPYSGFCFQYGTGNIVDDLTLVNDGSLDANFPGDLTFGNPTGTAVSGNTVRAVHQSGTTRHPTYALRFSASASNNAVQSGTLTSWTSARVSNLGTGNTYP